MDQLLVLATILTTMTSGTAALRCYQCHINPVTGQYNNTTERLCSHFDGSSKFIVECPASTMCMKQTFNLEIQNGVTVNGVLRDCARQLLAGQDFVGGKWYPKTQIVEPYKEGCELVDDKGIRTPSTSYCYCRADLCNSSSKTNHEGYTDIMGVILVFNLMKYIRSLR